jgi:hypothetical protein
MMPRAKKKQVSLPLPPESMRDPLADLPKRAPQELYNIARIISEQWPVGDLDNIDELVWPKAALETLRAWLEQPAQTEIRSMWWQGLAYIQAETPIPLRQALLHYLVQDTLTCFGIRLMAGSVAGFWLLVAMPGSAPFNFSALHVQHAMTWDDEGTMVDNKLGRQLARLFNLMITYAYELRLREKPWSVP